MPFNVVALVSGGKDSTMNMMKCVANGHKIVALANIFPAPAEGDELDSFMYQTVGHDAITSIAECLEVPMFRRPIQRGRSLTTAMEYQETDGDEVEDMFLLLRYIKQRMPHIDAVASGAILSNYQRTRVEAVCMRLGLTSLSLLWRRDQQELLDEMIDSNLHALLIKVACMGLKPRAHLGKNLADVRPTLHKLNGEFGCHICGEGGEFETFTLDCPLYKRRLCIDEQEVVMHQDDDYAPVAYLRFHKWHTELKSDDGSGEEADAAVTIVTDDLLREQGLLAAPVAREREDESKDSTIARENKNTLSARFRLFGARVASEVAGGETQGVEEEAEAVLRSVSDEMAAVGMNFQDAVLVGVYLADMSHFAAVNKVYSRFLPMRCPAARLCVGVPLPGGEGGRVAVEVLAGKLRQETLHVQSVSEWAPSNIGPYSQAKTVGGGGEEGEGGGALVLVSGQIGLDPASMTLVEGGQASEARQALRNLEAVLGVLGSGLARCFRATLFVAGDADPAPLLELWEAALRTKEPRACSATWVRVSALPRNARVEFQVAAVTRQHPPCQMVEVANEDEAVTISCCGVDGQACSATCMLPVAVGAEAQRGGRLGRAARACLASCGLSEDDIVSVRLLYAVDSGRGKSCDAADRWAGRGRLIDEFKQGFGIDADHSSRAFPITCLPAQETMMVSHEQAGGEVVEVLAWRDG